MNDGEKPVADKKYTKEASERRKGRERDSVDRKKEQTEFYYLFHTKEDCCSTMVDPHRVAVWLWVFLFC